MRHIAYRAAALFADHGYPSVAEEPVDTAEAFRAFVEGQFVRVAVADRGRPAGFAVAGALGGYLHLRELSVDPAHGRRGVGGALVDDVVWHAAELGHAAVSLSTFRRVRFNAPFYANHGFIALEPDAAPPELGDRFLAEVPPGIAPSDRTLMVKSLIYKD